MNQQLITFGLDLSVAVAQVDRKRFAIQSLDARGLRRIAKGSLTILIDDPLTRIVIETELIDYLSQLRGVISMIDGGHYETFTVSGDYFSNNFRYKYAPSAETIEIYEVNGGRFQVVVSYVTFKSSLLKFVKRAVNDFIELYPELDKNVEFRRMIC